MNESDELERCRAQVTGLQQALRLLKESWGTDLTEADQVEVVMARHEDGWRLWVNVNGVNRLRVYRIKKITLDGRE